MHLTGYALPLAQIKQFRQWGSITPGHPERGLTPGVETTTGPLGQGFANGVGMAMAEAHLAARYNRPEFEIINHFTYGLVSDGDLMEGVAAEAASLAGHLKLGKLIYLYDNNHITLAASTQLTFTEDQALRFATYGWRTQSIAGGNDLKAIDHAIQAAREETGRPSLILVRTHIGFGSPHKQDTFGAHGAPLGEEEVRLTKAPKLPGLMGGSADLNSSTHTEMATGDLQGSAASGWSYAGRNVQFGVREHAMTAILNGMAAHGGTMPFGATFLTFSDYMRPAIRLAALMRLPVVYVFTHDSICMGEDGPTHQPVEHLASLRAVPGLIVIRPGDANETAEAWVRCHRNKGLSGRACLDPTKRADV